MSNPNLKGTPEFELPPKPKLFADLEPLYSRCLKQGLDHLSKNMGATDFSLEEEEWLVEFKNQKQPIRLHSADAIIPYALFFKDGVYKLDFRLFQDGSPYIPIEDAALLEVDPDETWYYGVYAAPELPPFMVNEYYSFHEEIDHLSVPGKIADFKKRGIGIELSDQDCQNLSAALGNMELDLWKFADEYVHSTKTRMQTYLDT